MKDVISPVGRSAAVIAVLTATTESGLAQEVSKPAREYGFYHGMA